MPENFPAGRYVLAGTGGRRLVDPVAVRKALDVVFGGDFPDAHPSALVLSGMAEGYDELLARAAVDNGVPFWAAFPNRGYGRYYWGSHSMTGQDRLGELEELLALAEGVTYVCRGIYENGVHANFVRNQWMVDRANTLLAGPGGGGTWDCIRRAHEAGVAVIDVMRAGISPSVDRTVVDIAHSAATAPEEELTPGL